MGRGFESLQARSTGRVRYTHMVGVAQLASAPDCGSGGRGFESHHPPSKRAAPYQIDLIQGYRQAVRHRTLTTAFASSNLASPASLKRDLITKYGRVAQVVEHLTFNQVVRGSNPRTLMEKAETILFPLFSLKECSQKLFEDLSKRS